MPMISRPLTVDNKLVGLPAKERLTGRSVIDTSKLDDRTGMLTSDPGFTATAATEEKIAHIDGEKGILLSRDSPITSSGSTATSLRKARLVSVPLPT